MSEDMISFWDKYWEVISLPIWVKCQEEPFSCLHYASYYLLRIGSIWFPFQKASCLTNHFIKFLFLLLFASLTSENAFKHAIQFLNTQNESIYLAKQYWSPQCQPYPQEWLYQELRHPSKVVKSQIGKYQEVKYVPKGLKSDERLTSTRFREIDTSCSLIFYLFHAFYKALNTSFHPIRETSFFRLWIHNLWHLQPKML